MEKYPQGQQLDPVEVPKISPNMIVRTVVFLVALINAVAAMFGFNLGWEVNQVNLYEIVSGIFLVGSGFLAYYKNNNLTKEARVAYEPAKEKKKMLQEQKKLK